MRILTLVQEQVTKVADACTQLHDALHDSPPSASRDDVFGNIFQQLLKIRETLDLEYIKAKDENAIRSGQPDL